MVEFALVLPLFLVLIFGIMEAGWFFAQQVEVRNAAREGGRLAVVDYPTPGFGDSAAIVAEVCSRSALAPGSATVFVVDTGNDSARVTVNQTYASLTGFIPQFNNATITSTAEMRIERDSVTWSDTPLAGIACT